MRLTPWSVIPAAMVAAAALAVAGCGGGSASRSSAVPAPATTGTTAATAAKANVTMTLTIPNRTATMSRTSPQYISSSVLSGEITVSPGNQNYEYDLGVGSPLCTTAANGRTCTLSVPAPIGSDTFTVVLYDGAYASNAHSGTAVSGGSTIATAIAEGAANTVLPLVLGGVVDHSTVTIVQPTSYLTTGSSGRVIITAYDHGNSIIIAPGGYVNAAGAPVTFNVDASQVPGYALSLNGGTAATSINTGSPSDVITIAQFDTRAGIYLNYTASNSTAMSGDHNVAPVYTTSETTVTAATMMTTPGPMQGVAGLIGGIDHTGTEAFAYDGISTKRACTGTGLVDGAPQLSATSVYYALSAGAGDVSTVSVSPTPCSNALQLSSVTTVATTNLTDYWGIVPGTLSSACTGAVTNGPNATWTLNGTSCTNPQNLTQDINGSNGWAFTFTSSSGKEVGYFSGANDPGTHVVATTGSIAGMGAYGGLIYVVDASSATVDVYNVPSLTVRNTFPIPAVTTNCLLGTAREFVVGDNGHGFLALGGIGCSYDGVIEFTLPDGVLVNKYPSLSGVYSVASDHRGHMYWANANGQLIEFPSTTP